MGALSVYCSIVGLGDNTHYFFQIISFRSGEHDAPTANVPPEIGNLDVSSLFPADRCLVRHSDVLGSVEHCTRVVRAPNAHAAWFALLLHRLTLRLGYSCVHCFTSSARRSPPTHLPPAQTALRGTICSISMKRSLANYHHNPYLPSPPPPPPHGCSCLVGHEAFKTQATVMKKGRLTR